STVQTTASASLCAPSGAATAAYFTMPVASAGAVHEMVIEPMPTVAVTFVGAAVGWYGVTVTALLAGLSPDALFARTVTEYWWRLVRPLMSPHWSSLFVFRV